MDDQFYPFTDDARRVLVLAQEEAKRLNHNYIGTEHILLGLARVENNISSEILKTLGVTLLKVRDATEFIIGRGVRSVIHNPGLTPRGKKVLELAVQESKRLGEDEVNPGHLLLGLVLENEGVAFGILESLGISLDRIRAEYARIKLLDPSIQTVEALSPVDEAFNSLRVAIQLHYSVERALADFVLEFGDYEGTSDLESSLERTESGVKSSRQIYEEAIRNTPAAEN